MRKIKYVACILLASVLLLSSCTTFRSEYYVEGEPYLVQEKGQFAKPADPILAENEVLDGWTLEGTEGLYTDWDQQPKGVTRFDAQISKLIGYYVGDKLLITQTVADFEDPGNPITTATRDGKVRFIGWYPEDSDEPVTDWTEPVEGVYRYDARFVELVYYYVDDEVWLIQRIDEFGNPGDPFGKDVPRGYEFKGWVPVNDYEPYDDWAYVPEGVRRFDALFSQTLQDSGLDSSNSMIHLNLEKDFVVLGPVSVEETYEVVGDEVKVGGVSYKDIIDAALVLYPETDQVINIVVDHKNQELKTDLATLNFETASYTGLAIDIE